MSKPSPPWIKLGLVLFGGLGFLPAETAVQPLNLERVVVRGETRRSPMALERSVDHGEISSTKKQSSQERGSTQHHPIRSRTQLGIGHGSFDHWGGSLSQFIMRHNTSLGVFLDGLSEEGYRNGYDKRQHQVRAEWEQRTMSQLDLKVSLGHLRRKMDLPEPTTLPNFDDKRLEKILDASVQLSSNQNDSRQWKILFDAQDAQQSHSHASDFSYEMYRLGGIMEQDGFDTALSIEWDRKGPQQTTLLRYFVKGEKRSLDHQTTLHGGLGVYALSSRRGNVDSSGFLSIVEKNKNTSLALSPYLRLDHEMRDDLDFYLAYTQFYDSLPMVKTFFDQPEFNTPPTNILQPSLHMQIEGGFRLELQDKWNFTIAYEWHRRRHQQVQVIDIPALNGRLTTQTWDRGIEGVLSGHLRAEVHPQLQLETSYRWRWSNWENPQIDFTPYLPLHEFLFDFFYRHQRWTLNGELRITNGVKSYPVVQNLPNRVDLNFEMAYQHRSYMTFLGRIENALNRDMAITFAFPDRPWSVYGGFKVHF